MVEKHKGGRPLKSLTGPVGMFTWGVFVLLALLIALPLILWRVALIIPLACARFLSGAWARLGLKAYLAQEGPPKPVLFVGWVVLLILQPFKWWSGYPRVRATALRRLYIAAGVLCGVWARMRLAILATSLEDAREDLEANQYGSLGESSRAPLIRERIERIEGRIEDLCQSAEALAERWERPRP